MHATTRPSKGTHKGEIAGFFPSDLLHDYCKPFHFDLIGKFSQGRPNMEAIHGFFKAQDFLDTYSVGLLNPRHIIVKFHGERDLHRFYSCKLWYIGDFPTRIFKWTPDFHANRESSIVPIWFKFPGLPVQFFNSDALSFLASLFDTPLRWDSATASFKRPSVARIQVEIDLLKPLPHRLWVGTGDNVDFWQKFEPDEDLPSYCQYCWHVGHSEKICTVKHPELKSLVAPPFKPKLVPKPIIRQEYRPIAKQVLDSALPTDVPHPRDQMP